MNARLETITAALLGLLAISGIDGRAQSDYVAPAIQARKQDENTIRVIVPGQFETTFAKRKGFGGVWFDLKHEGKCNGSYWNEGYEEKDLRAGLDDARGRRLFDGASEMPQPARR